MKPAGEREWFWATLLLSSITIIAVVFALWELLENRYFQNVDYMTLHYLYITRGIASSLVLALWAAWYVLRQRRRSEEKLRRSREHYRGLLEASPGAIALYDENLIVSEWNAAAERLYGFNKAEVLRQPLPTVPADKKAELQSFLDHVAGGAPILDAETSRQALDGTLIAVQLSLLPFRDGARTRFLEVTADIRERVRLQQTLLELEKLATMGKMAAGTAHHLNTPLATMLLRIQMMRERAGDAAAVDLESLEAGVASCRHFVQRLLEFSRRAPLQKQPEELVPTVQSVTSFFSPSLAEKRARLVVEADGAGGAWIDADRNQIEALLLILLSNALDAIEPGGSISVRCRRPSSERVEIQVVDDGSGIEASHMSHIFEPFFTTKGPGRGTGLGLAMARNIVLEHGGSIRLEGGDRQGARAVVELPVCSPVGRRQEMAS